MSVTERLNHIRLKIPADVRLVAVSKTKPVSDIMEAYQAGQRVFGENKAQDLIAKQPELPEDIEWHFIGHLQTNKVKYLTPFVGMIESVDSLKLLKEIDKQSAKNGRVVNCLLQFHIASEQSKFGLDLEEASQILESEEYTKMKHIRLCGVMGMATFTDDKEILKREFIMLRDLYNSLKNNYFPENKSFREISMGMSGDYLLAIEEGSTNVRVGTAIFGTR
ncbi:MAG: YggS family pyridoxal phosphate-dependent enzyme [Bacteroidetes bacterium]|nr:MAG: YggS family pyridoxal phosphate-dependent enzyme [Bacteroidota bacterium]